MVASDDLRDALSVIYLTYAHSRRSVSIRCQGYIGDFVLGCLAKDLVCGGGWTNHKRKGGTWRMSDGSVRGAGGQISVQGSGRVQYEVSIPEASRWTGGMI
ncbi:hypothetical protein Tco_0510922 [Tanacetum coccineum]